MKRLRLWLVALAVFGLLGLIFLSRSQQTETPFQIGKPLPPGRVQPQLCVTWDYGVMLAPDGSLWVWGGSQSHLQHVTNATSEIPLRLGKDSDWAQVSCGSPSVIIALKQNGTAWCWGMSSDGKPQPQKSPPAPLSLDTNWTAVSGGSSHALLLKRDGSLWAIGQNDRGQIGCGSKITPQPLQQIGDGTNWAALSAGSFNSYALQRDGTLWGWGFDFAAGAADKLVPTQIDPGTNWVAISAGDYHLVARKNDGSLWLLGQNAHVVVSSVTSQSLAKPMPVENQTTPGQWTDVISGQNAFLTRKTDGSWWASGADNSGVLGFGKRGNADRPRRIGLDLDPWALGLGSQTALLLARDGTLWSWGARLGAPPGRGSLTDRVESWVTRLFNQRAGARPYPQCDLYPHKIWELPEVAATLSPTNRPGVR